MKKKLNLVQTNLKSLKKKQLRNIRGGELCGCACCVASTGDNGVANSDAGKTSTDTHPC